MILQKLRREISHNIHFTRPTEFSQLMSWLDIRAGDHICDVGCGDGYWTSKLAGADRNVIGVDIDESDLSRAERFYGHITEFIMAPAERLPIGANTMDKVTSLCAMEHFLDDRMALAEIRRILRPKGRLYMSLDSLSLPAISTAFKKHHAGRYDVRRLYTRRSIKSLLEQEGFRLLKSSYLATSRITSSLVQFQLLREWNVNYIAPLALPIARVSDRVLGREDAGHILLFLAENGP